MLRCGVSEGIPGFSEKDAKGNWKGLDADFCRAVAAAALGDGSKVRFVPLRAAERLHITGGSKKLRLLPDQISKEPLAPVVCADDEEWITLVRWVLFLLINAEEFGITQNNIHKITVDNPTPGVIRSLGACRIFAKPMGIPSDWAIQVIRQVSNYGEIFERNLGEKSPYHLDRGLNRLWKQHGLMYSPPMR